MNGARGMFCSMICNGNRSCEVGCLGSGVGGGGGGGGTAFAKIHEEKRDEQCTPDQDENDGG